MQYSEYRQSIHNMSSGGLSNNTGPRASLPLRNKSPANRSRSNGRTTPGDKIVDIQTEDMYYTEVFSWGSDHAGQLGLGSGELSSD